MPSAATRPANGSPMTLVERIDAVDVAAADDPLVDALGRDRVVFRLHHQHQPVVGLVAGIDDALDHLREIGVAEDEADFAGNAQAEHAGTARGEGAGGGVRLVAVLRDDLVDARPGVVAYPLVAIDDAGDGRPGHPGDSGDLFEIHVFGVPCMRALPRLMGQSLTVICAMSRRQSGSLRVSRGRLPWPGLLPGPGRPPAACRRCC